jgi:hypothetical protein
MPGSTHQRISSPAGAAAPRQQTGHDRLIPATAPGARSPWQEREEGPRAGTQIGLETRQARAERFGHSLDRLALRRPERQTPTPAARIPEPRPLPALVTPPAAAASALVTPPAAAASVPIQRQRSWRKKLAGLGAVGGGLSVLGGIGGLVAGVAAAPVMLGLGGLALLGGGGYLAYKHMTSDSRRLQQVRSSSGPQGNRPDELVHNILNDVAGRENLRGTDISDEPSDNPRGDSSRVGEDRNRHVVRLDPRQTDRNKRLSYLAHELTHVSADRKYTMNELQGATFYNQDQPPHDVDDTRQYLDQRRGVLSNHLTQARDLIDNDPHLGEDHRNYFRQRLGYAVDSPMNEHDTVLNELTVYGHLEGISGESPTLNRIRQLAGAAHNRRNADR